MSIFQELARRIDLHESAEARRPKKLFLTADEFIELKDEASHMYLVACPDITVYEFMGIPIEVGHA